MIPREYVLAWRANAPWAFESQVEQDLVISRAMVEIFRDPFLRTKLAFRGGTALHKLYFNPVGRYSEDIDLVQVAQEPIGDVIERLRSILTPWLGKAKFEANEKSAKLKFRFETSSLPTSRMALKIEINTREHQSVLGHVNVPIRVDSPWFAAETTIVTYRLEELLGTKLRALYERDKGRDAFDLDRALAEFPEIDRHAIVRCFREYLAWESKSVPRVAFEDNMKLKREKSSFTSDIAALLPASRSFYDAQAGIDVVLESLVRLLP